MSVSISVYNERGDRCETYTGIPYGKLPSFVDHVKADYCEGGREHCAGHGEIIIKIEGEIKL